MNVRHCSNAHRALKKEEGRVSGIIDADAVILPMIVEAIAGKVTPLWREMLISGPWTRVNVASLGCVSIFSFSDLFASLGV